MYTFNNATQTHQQQLHRHTNTSDNIIEVVKINTEYYEQKPNLDEISACIVNIAEIWRNHSVMGVIICPSSTNLKMKTNGISKTFQLLWRVECVHFNNEGNIGQSHFVKVAMYLQEGYVYYSSSRPELVFRKGVLKILEEFTRNRRYRSPFFNKIATLDHLKTPENHRFSGVSRVYEMATLARNMLKKSK